MEARATNRGSGRRRPLVVAAVWIMAVCGGDGGSPPVAPEDTDSAHAVASIEINPSERTVGILGVTVELAAGAYAADGSHVYGLRSDPGRFSWSSSGPDVATVDAAAVTAVSEGTGTITATVEGVEGSTTVTVRDRARFAWSVPIPGDIGAGNVMGADGTIYVGTNDFAAQQSFWYAVAPEGGVLWTQGLPLTGRSNPAIGDDGTLYLGSRTGSGATGFTGRLIAVDPGGTVQWRLEDIDGIRSSPALGADGTIYVAGGHHVYAVDPRGEIQWTYERDDDVFVFSSPAIASDGTIYVGDYDNLLHAINPDGSLRWTFETRDVIQSSPSIGTSGTIYFGSMDGRLYAVNPDGTERWSVELDWRGISSSPSIGPDGTIYIGAGGVFAVDPGGSIRWNYAPSNWVSATPILGADGTVYIGACCGITALDAQGELLWGYGTGGHFLGSPAIGVDGTIIAASFSGASADVDSWEGTVHAIVETSSTNGGYAGSPWPTARGGRANTGRAGG